MLAKDVEVGMVFIGFHDTYTVIEKTGSVVLLKRSGTGLPFSYTLKNNSGLLDENHYRLKDTKLIPPKEIDWI